jgi:hypothetical protein
MQRCRMLEYSVRYVWTQGKVDSVLGYTMSDIPENNLKDCVLHQPPVWKNAKITV